MFRIRSRTVSRSFDGVHNVMLDLRPFRDANTLIPRFEDCGESQ
jgi:hypothetical protein